ncbi:MAG: MBL fold metallo-hydrolase [bacterium]|nr:MBL fold metallo-hydrolase [bacterium]
MDIVYLGHSAFQLKGKRGTVVMDPYQDYVGFSLPSVTADIVTASHQHPDHNAISAVKSTSRREKPFTIVNPGEYEVGGISVFGTQTYHDSVEGAERGINIIYTVLIDELKLCHLGDLGHELTPELIEAIGEIDILLCPVGGHFTINAAQAVATINQLEPSIVIPMHFRTDQHDEKVFGDVAVLDVFLKEYGMATQPQPKLQVEKGNLPATTELVVLSSR